MNFKDISKKVNSAILCLMSHPDNEPNSEFADRIDDLIDVKDQIDQVNGADLKLSTCNLQNVVGSALKDDERVHYEALQDCCKGILKVVDSGKVPQRGIMGLRLLLPK